MSVLVRFTPPSLSAEDYDKTVQQLRDAGDFPPDGLDVHVCFGSDGELKVSEIWDSREQFEAFGPKLLPVLEEHDIDPGQPEMVEVHNIVRR